LRGGKQPNYDTDSVNFAARGLREAGLAERLMIDLSHANSRKQFDKQIEVGADVAGQIAKGDQRIMGIMIESHLTSGRQDVKPGQELVYGQSITDGCISWEKTTPLLRLLADAVNCRRSVDKL
jgi:3-deoxy-7-phosphoheptulonate synthase